MDDDAPRRSRPATLPRPLAALSIAVGLGLPLAVMIRTDGMAGANLEQQFTAMIMLIVFHVGYILAPFLIGFGQWRSFFAGLALAPAVAGWVSLFLPGLGGDPLLSLLAAVSAVALLGDYAWIFRHMAMEFFSNRKGGNAGGN